MYYNEIKINDTATMYTYLLDEKISYNVTRKWPCVIVVPGGGYLLTSTREGESVVTRFIAAGFSCILLRYSTKVKNRATRELNEGFGYPDPSIELLEALHLIHQNAEKWHIDTDNIYINAYSAGAHIAMTSILRAREDFIQRRLSFVPPKEELKIKGYILGYPMVNVHTMNEVIQSALFASEDYTEEDVKALDMSLYLNEQTSPMFIWQTGEDELVSPVAVWEFVGRALQLGIPTEYHLFQHGPHGLAMADELYAKSEADINPEAAVWFEMALRWIRKL